MSTSPLVSMQEIRMSFGGTVALDNVDFEIEAGEIHAIAGENGAGKSTLMKILAGIYRPDHGRIRLRGLDRSFDDVTQATASGIVVIHQELNLVDSLSAVENVFLGKELRTAWGLPDHAAMRERAVDMLGRLGFHADPGQLVSRLSMGEKQLVEIAKALLVEAEVLIMDEPTSALSDAETESLYALCRRLREQGMGIVLITHRLQEMFLLADRITVLRDGARVGTWRTEEIESPASLVSLMIGRKFSTLEMAQASQAAEEAEPVFSVSRLFIHSPSRALVEDVSFAVAPGEVLGISGLLGSGKTEILEALFGTSPHRVVGDFRFAGRKRRFTAPDEAVAAGMAMVTEDRKRDGLLPEHGIEANFLLPLLDRLPGYPLYDAAAARRTTLEYCRTFDVRYKNIEQTGGTLSGGNQQKLIIGKWLSRAPHLLLLDEPTRGVDTASKAEIYALIRHATEKGLSVIVASSEIDELMLLCDRILVLCAGRMTGILKKAGFSADRLVQLAAGH